MVISSSHKLHSYICITNIRSNDRFIPDIPYSFIEISYSFDFVKEEVIMVIAMGDMATAMEATDIAMALQANQIIYF